MTTAMVAKRTIKNWRQNEANRHIHGPIPTSFLCDKLVLNTVRFITTHPLTRGRPLAAIGRYVWWQIQSRVRHEVRVDWIDGATLVARNGMTGATGNIYCGLHEFADMAFLLHLLLPEDLFVDVGANIGSYTVLASAVCRARSIAIEPDPDTMIALKRNIVANEINQLVETVEVAIGSETGEAKFTVGRDTVNHMAKRDDADARTVRVERLDTLLAGRLPLMIKMDVEGFEADVLAGAGQVLANASLLAVETEGREPAVVSYLEGAGFQAYTYDPWGRQLRKGDGPSANALYLRGIDEIRERLDGAKKRNILGHVL